MSDRHERAVAVVGVAAILPDAPDASAFWRNVREKRYSIGDVPDDRWSVADYYDPDPGAPDKTYSRIGGWVRGFEFDWKRFHVPPRVAAAMDDSQKWAVTIAADALADYGHPDRPLDCERTAVVLGTAMGGEMHDLTTLRIGFPEFSRALSGVSEFLELPKEVQAAILERWHERVGRALPPITEDTMPGELANIVSGRVANVLNLRGPNFITDAACASTLAAVDAAVDLLVARHCDAVITGGVDRNMGIGSFVKFCKIGALSATGSRPFADGADGFVMGEGAGAFLLKRLADAERDGDRIYAVIRGVGASSDGRGKAITAPNPVGQRLAVRRAWDDAGLDPATVTMVEAHGTSTKVGDLVEVESLAEVFRGAPKGAVALGSVKSNIGHLKAGAGAAGLLKAVLALHHKVFPPTVNAERPNPAIDFAAMPFFVSQDLREWPGNGVPRRAGVSAYGFGGTNFHLVLEEHVPGMLTRDVRGTSVAVGSAAPRTGPSLAPAALRAPLRGIAALGAPDRQALRAQAEALLARARSGSVPAPALPGADVLAAPERLVVDFGTPGELVERLEKARRAFALDTPAAWRPLPQQGVFRGTGPRRGSLAFVFPGQGSQYVNMGRALGARERVVADTFDEADRVLAPALGRPLTSYIFVDAADPAALEAAEAALMQTAITQPAVLSMDVALARLLGEFGFAPDLVMGHSLGEYAALVAASVLPLADAIEAAAARGREMTKVTLADNGQMAAVMAPIEVVDEVLAGIDGYVIAANINSRKQCVIGGATAAVASAVEAFRKRGVHSMPLPVSHAFHTRIVAPAAAPLREVLDRLRVAPPRVPVVANVTGEPYPSDVDGVKDHLERQIASAVQWVKSVETAYAMGVRTFLEVGPKRALKGFVEEVLGDRDDVVALHTNQPKPGDVESFNQALCGLYAAGWGARAAEPVEIASPATSTAASVTPAPPPIAAERLDRLTSLLEQALDRLPGGPARTASDRNDVPVGSIVVSGTGLGLPGAGKPVMDPANALRILRGEQFVDLVPDAFRRALADKHITRVVKGEDGSGHFAVIEDTADVIKLAGVGGSFDLTEEYGVPAKLVEALDVTTQLAMAAGLDALREAGIPLVQTWRKTTTGKHLPDRWRLPEPLRDETGVVFASAFPGYDRFADELTRYNVDQGRRRLRDALDDLRRYTSDPSTLAEIHRRLREVEEERAREPYEFDRRFLFRVLTMGHSQFAEYVGARGPVAHVNAACASTAQGISLAEDWIRSGRCRRVVVIGADDATSERLFPWIGSGFLASGAAATDDKVEEAALPFDRRRHGTLLGMGACALVVESQDAVEERGMRGLVELLATEARNSAHHATRLDPPHIASAVESLVTAGERRFGLNRLAMAPETVFVSHETFTPARGGSAAAEVEALRRVFGAAASEIVVANTKGFTGHPMGVGIEDVIGVKILEHGLVPPVPNYKEVDPDLGRLNLSRGGRYPVRYAIHLAAGFGSQVALTLTRRVPGGLDRVDSRPTYERWLSEVSGDVEPRTEVVRRVLRVVATGVPSRRPAASAWRFGLGPCRRTPAMPVSVPSAVRGGARESSLPDSVPVSVSVPSAVGGGAPKSSVSVPVSVPVSDPISARVLAIVAEKTGYPPEMLEMDLDLEADLGVDTVKQAETFAAVREEWDIPREESLRLRDFPTLRHVVQFVLDRRPDLATASVSSAVGGGAPKSSVSVPISVPGQADPISARVLAIVAEKTGYPPEMLEMDLDLEADLGVDTVKQAETFAAVREEWDIPREESLRLRDFPTLRHVMQFVLDRRPDLSSVSVPSAVGGGAPKSSVPSSVSDPISARVLAIVAEKTGYPTEMLEMDLDLEADLGVDTVKQAETFAAVREEWDIPREESLRLRDFPTLRHVVQFVLDRRPDLSSVSVPSAVGGGAPKSSVPSSVSVPISARVLAIVAEKTGYPPEMLEMDLDLEADLGVDTVKQAETFAAVREEWDIPREESLRLRDFPTLRHVVQFVLDRRPDLSSVSVPSAVGGGAPKSSVPSSVSVPVSAPASVAAPTALPLENADRFPRRVPIPVLRPPLDLCVPTGVTLGATHRVVIASDGGGVAAALEQRLRARGVDVVTLDPADAFVAERAAALAGSGPIDGVFWLPALDVEPALADMTLDDFREANRVRVKSLHAAMRALYDAVGTPGTFLVSATRLGGLLGHGDTPATAPLGGGVVGFTKAFRKERPEALVKVVDFARDAPAGDVAQALVDEALRDPAATEVGRLDGRRFTIALEERKAAGPGLTLGPDSVFVVTGAAGGITSAIVADLAAASRGTFHLLDLAPLPAPDDPKVALLRADREQLKAALIEEAKARGEKPLPPAIEREILGIERQDAALRAVQAVTAAGGRAVYRSLNLLDGAAVAQAMTSVREAHGRIDVILHAGGIEISRELPQKPPEEFARVLDIKADGFFSLLKGAEDMPVGATVVFSSVAGRFGNGGQTDYSAANALLCALSSHLRAVRPGTRTIAIDWTAWAGIGMATRGSIPKIMEAAGVEMLPPEIGIPTVRREIVASAGSGEVLVAGRLGAMLREWHPTGGIDLDALAARIAGRGKLLMVGRPVSASVFGGLTTEVRLDPARQPFLRDHALEGTPLLPGVMAAEAFAEIAHVLVPDLEVTAVEEVRFDRPLKFYRNEPATFRLQAQAVREGGSLAVLARLVSLIQPKPDVPAVEKVHFAGRVLLAPLARRETRLAFAPPAPADMTIEAGAIYRVYFHGPAYKVLERVKVDDVEALGLMADGLPADTDPPEAALLMEPRLIELCFQTAGLQELVADHRLALPRAIRSVRVVRRAVEASGRRLWAQAVRGPAGGFTARVLDDEGYVYVEMEGYETVTLEEGRTLAVPPVNTSA